MIYGLPIKIIKAQKHAFAPFLLRKMHFVPKSAYVIPFLNIWGNQLLYSDHKLPDRKKQTTYYQEDLKMEKILENVEDIEVMEVSEASLLGETAATSGSSSCGSCSTCGSTSCISCGGDTSVSM